MKTKKSKKIIKVDPTLQWFNISEPILSPDRLNHEGWVGLITLKTKDSGFYATPRSYVGFWCQVANSQYTFMSLGGNRIVDDLTEIASFERYEDCELGIIKCV